MAITTIPAGFTLIRLAPVPPRKEHLILTQTKGSRHRTNRGNGGKIPTQVR